MPNEVIRLRRQVADLQGQLAQSQRHDISTQGTTDRIHSILSTPTHTRSPGMNPIMYWFELLFKIVAVYVVEGIISENHW